MYSTELSANATRDKRKSMRTSAIIHIILILLALIPFLRTQMQPKDFKQVILVEFDKEQGSSNEGSRMSSASSQDESSEAAPSEELEREVKPETKPIEVTTPPAVLTSTIEPPIMKTSKVKKVEVKTTKPMENIPQNAEVKHVPAPVKEQVLQPSKVRKVTVAVERPPATGSGSGNNPNSKNSGSGGGNAGSNDGGSGQGGQGSSASGDGNTDGQGEGNRGDGKSDRGNGAEGKGQGNASGDGILSRQIIKYPDLKGIIKESGKLSFYVCVDRNGKVTHIEFNKGHSSIKDMDVIRKSLSGAKEYLFEKDLSAPDRECGRLTFNFKIDS